MARLARIMLADVIRSVDTDDFFETAMAPIEAPAAPVGMSTKRVVDVVLALSGIVLLAPLLIVCFVSTLLASPGPALFRHRRVGFNGKHFDCLKFRTMRVDAPARLRQRLESDPAAAAAWAANRKLRNDPRVTAIGAILRKSSLDELPQLFNVLRGDMSIIGPRPTTDEELARYGNMVGAYLSCRPGITGLWQVSTRSTATYGKRVAFDSFYAHNWSIGLDFKILAVTLPALIFETMPAVIFKMIAAIVPALTIDAPEAPRGAIQASQALGSRRNAVKWFVAGLALAIAGMACFIAGIVNLSYPFELFGIAALALGCVTATLALLRGEQLEQEADFNGT